MKFITFKFLFIIFVGSISTNSLFSQNQLWIRDLTKDKEFLLPKMNYETYFRVPVSYYHYPHDTLFSRFYPTQFPPDSGFIGNPFDYIDAIDDSITLELDYVWKQGMTIPKTIPLTYDSTGRVQITTVYLTPYTRRIALDDISEIYVQRTYHDFSEDVWIWGGFLGGISLLASPFVFFFEDKKLGAGMFAFGAAGVGASIISYKYHFGYKEYKKPHFEFFWDKR